MNNLQIRLTHTYVGEYQHLDDWHDIGSYDVQASDYKESDDGSGGMTTIFAKVRLYDGLQPSNKQIRAALEDSNTSDGCACAHDCCGCVSHYATAKHIKGKLWRIRVTSSRNY